MAVALHTLSKFLHAEPDNDVGLIVAMTELEPTSDVFNHQLDS